MASIWFKFIIPGLLLLGLILFVLTVPCKNLGYLCLFVVCCGGYLPVLAIIVLPIFIIVLLIVMVVNIYPIKIVGQIIISSLFSFPSFDDIFVYSWNFKSPNLWIFIQKSIFMMFMIYDILEYMYMSLCKQSINIFENNEDDEDKNQLNDSRSIVSSTRHSLISNDFVPHVKEVLEFPQRLRTNRMNRLLFGKDESEEKANNSELEMRVTTPPNTIINMDRSSI